MSRVAKEIGEIIDRWDSYAAQGRTVGSQDIVVHRNTLASWLLHLCPPRVGTRKIRSESAIRKARRATRKQLDAMCRDLVFLRDANRCRRCGKTRGKLDWSHVYAKGAHPWLRWDLDNSKVLCAQCHMNWWHGHPEDAMKWWEHEIGTEAMQALRLRAAKPRKATSAMVLIYLQQEAKRMGAPVQL